MLGLSLVVGCGFEPASGYYDVELHLTSVDAPDRWNLSVAVDDTDVWRVKGTGDGVQFHATSDCTLSETTFRCEPYAVVNGGVHGDLQLEGRWFDERTFDGVLVTTWWCDGGACPTGPAVVTQDVAGTWDAHEDGATRRASARGRGPS